MNKKIISFITNGKEFLVLRNNLKDPAHGGDHLESNFLAFVMKKRDERRTQ
ncbi:MAG: hypothetical protein NUV97_01240 [archaeon]|nr:hypothetical protein [archaeon]MCR4323413.1 hypothetical protein [Nanoarchaeota archaeon]